MNGKTKTTRCSNNGKLNKREGFIISNFTSGSSTIESPRHFFHHHHHHRLFSLLSLSSLFFSSFLFLPIILPSFVSSTSSSSSSSSSSSFKIIDEQSSTTYIPKEDTEWGTAIFSDDATTTNNGDKGKKDDEKTKLSISTSDEAERKEEEEEEEEEEEVDIAIIGGGLTGLAVAIGLSKTLENSNTTKIRLYERSSQLRSISQGILCIKPHGLNSLKYISEDIPPLVRKFGCERLKLVMTIVNKNDDDDNLIVNETMDEHWAVKKNRTGLVNFGITWHRMQQILASLVPNKDIIKTGKSFSHFVEEEEEEDCEESSSSSSSSTSTSSYPVKLYFEDGTFVRCKVALACDGVFSVARKQIIPNTKEDRPIYFGQLNWGSILRTNTLPPRAGAAATTAAAAATATTSNTYSENRSGVGDGDGNGVRGVSVGGGSDGNKSMSNKEEEEEEEDTSNEQEENKKKQVPQPLHPSNAVRYIQYNGKPRYMAMINDGGDGYTFFQMRIVSDDKHMTMSLSGNEGRGGLGLPGVKSKLLQIAKRTCPDVALVLNATPESTIYERSIVSRQTPSTWISKGKRVALVGDSAHGMHPNIGQGANTAFGSAAVLVDAFSKLSNRNTIIGNDIDYRRALVEYEKRRKPRADLIQKFSNMFGCIQTTGNEFLNQDVMSKMIKWIDNGNLELEEEDNNEKEEDGDDDEGRPPPKEAVIFLKQFDPFSQPGISPL